jgi:hypothetical protein
MGLFHCCVFQDLDGRILVTMFEEDRKDSGGSISHAQVESRDTEVSWEYWLRSTRDKMVSSLLPSLFDLVGGEFRKAPPVTSFGHKMPIGCWIGWNSVVCSLFLGRAALEGSDAKRHCQLPP